MTNPELDLDHLMRELGVDTPRPTKAHTLPDGPPQTSTTRPLTAEASSLPDVFQRRDPAQSPPPPDLTGGGLGETIEAGIPTIPGDDQRIRPDDAIREFWRPEESPDANGADLGQTLLETEAVAADILRKANGKKE